MADSRSLQFPKVKRHRRIAYQFQVMYPQICKEERRLVKKEKGETIVARYQHLIPHLRATMVSKRIQTLAMTRIKEKYPELWNKVKETEEIENER